MSLSLAGESPAMATGVLCGHEPLFLHVSSKTLGMTEITSVGIRAHEYLSLCAHYIDVGDRAILMELQASRVSGLLMGRLLC